MDDSVQQVNEVANFFIFYVVARGRTKNARQKLSQTHLNEKKCRNLHNVSKLHLFYCLCVSCSLSVKKENNFDGESSQERPLEIKRCLDFEEFERRSVKTRSAVNLGSFQIPQVIIITYRP